MGVRAIVVETVVSVLILASAVAASGKTTIVISQFESLGVDEATAKTAVELLLGELSKLDAFHVVAGEEVCRNGKEAVLLGRSLGTEKGIAGSIYALGTKIVVRVCLVDVETGRVEYEDQIVSASVEELDVVMKSVALGLVQKNEPEKTADVETRVEKEPVKARKHGNFYCSGPAIGKLNAVGNSYGGVSGLGTFEADVWYQTPDFAGQVVVGVGAGDEVSALCLDLGLLKFLSPTDLSPYAGASLGLHWIFINFSPFRGPQDGTAGLAVSPEVGLVAFRRYPFHLLARAKYVVVFAGLPEQSTQHGFGVSLGLLARIPETQMFPGLGCLFF